jgi:hypothetical protein
VQDVLPHRLPLFGKIRVGLALGLDVDRGTVVCGDAREGGAVVIGVVPDKPALVAGVMPEADRELNRLDRLLAVERYGVAVGLDLLATPRPQVWVPPEWCIAERVAGGLAKRPALALSFLQASSRPSQVSGKVFNPISSNHDLR